MVSENINEIKSPIIYMAISLFFGNLCYGIYGESKEMAIVVAIFFFSLSYGYKKIKFLGFMIIFFSLGVIGNLLYYNLASKEDFSGKVRIKEQKAYYTLAEYNGRRVYLDYENYKFNINENYYVKGEFLKEVKVDKGIVGTIKVEKILYERKDFIYYVTQIREKIYISLEKNIGSRKAALVTSLAFGYTDYLDNEDSSDMRALGIVHIISVSGLHVSLIFNLLKRLLKDKLAIVITGGYVLLTAVPMSSVRAYIMLICLSQSISFRKNYNALAALALSFIILFIIRPYCIFNLGFMLSYSSTLGIILYSKKLNKKFYKLPKYIRETLSLSIAAQVFTLPILIIAFKEISPWALIGNLILVPIFNLVIVLGNSLLIFYKFNSIFKFICYCILKSINVIDYISDIFYDYSRISFITNISMAIFIFIILLSAYFIKRQYKIFYILPIIAMMVISFCNYSVIPKVSYLEEGAILISYKGERALMPIKDSVDILKLKKSTLANKVILEDSNLVFSNIKINYKNKDIYMIYKGKKYKFRLNKYKFNNYKEENLEYDIIDFIEEDIKGFYVLDNKLVMIK